MKREGKRAELTIHGLTDVDAGQYRCVAGGSQSTAHVKVEGRLKLVCGKLFEVRYSNNTLYNGESLFSDFIIIMTVQLMT